MTKRVNKDVQRYICEVYLPLRRGQVGRFLGIFDRDGTALRTHGGYLRGHRLGERFTGSQQLRGMPDGAWFRNETVGVTFEYNGCLWEPVLVDNPNGCRYCDHPQRGHGNNWIDQPGVGRHHWTPPTDQQRKHRMQWRRYFDVRGRGSMMPTTVPFTLARGTALPS